jgi:hypothetical protein
MFIGGGARRLPQINIAAILQRNSELKSPAAKPPRWMAVISVADHGPETPKRMHLFSRHSGE